MRALVVSIHDVSPLTRSAADYMLEELRHLGVSNCSLLVIPDHHRRGSFCADAEFCTWLCERAAAGNEPVIHGFYHRRQRRKKETCRQKLITRIYTADEGEFYDIAQDVASTLLMRARADFGKIGLHPCGFIAPAWLLSAEAEKALRQLRFNYTARLRHVIDLRNQVVHQSQSLVYSVRSAWRRALSRRWNYFLFHRLRYNPLLRIGLHPVDITFPKVWTQARALVARALEDRVPLTYEGWLKAACHGKS